ncbi:Uncharacterised protein [Yersinia nurmii]|uniref:Secreted protein n=1 Tax=Yersinia nurmii TaxID=685706 RepID=A0ABM9S6V2_9GAMM|nr:Uncharacterised protein [Yersinia nurmii]
MTAFLLCVLIRIDFLSAEFPHNLIFRSIQPVNSFLFNRTAKRFDGDHKFAKLGLPSAVFFLNLSTSETFRCRSKK